MLRDEFTTDLAAGSVNGTAAEPGPGTRDVVDTGSNLEILSGTLNLSASVGAGDPRLSLTPAVIKQPGIMVKCQVSGTEMTVIFFGWADGLSGVVEYCTLADNGQLLVRLASIGSITVGNGLSNATAYIMVCVLRDAGAYLYIKGGIYTTYTLLWIDNTLATSPVYPAASISNADLSFNYIRVPDALFLPTPSAYDTFTRANGNPGSSEGTGPDGQSTPARIWTEQSGDWEISSNKLQTAAGGAGIATIQIGVADVLYQATITTSGAGTTPAGLILRYSDTSNYWYLKITPGTAGTDLELVEVNAGAPTTRASADIDWAVSTEYEIVVVCDGDDEWRVYVDNVASFTYTTTNTFNETATIYGVEDEGNTNFLFDDLLLFSRGNDGSFSELDRY